MKKKMHERKKLIIIIIKKKGQYTLPSLPSFNITASIVISTVVVRINRYLT